MPEPVADDANKLPETIYGQTKLACEHLLEWYRRIHGLSVGAVRFPWVYGPGRINGITAAYSTELLDTIARGKPVELDSGKEVGDWLYVKDAVRALNLMLENQLNPSIAYNIMGSVHSVEEAMSIAADLFPDADIVIRDKPKAPYPYPSAFDDRKAREEIGWAPQYSLSDGIREHIENVRAKLAEAGPEQ